MFFTQAGNELEWSGILKPFHTHIWLIILAWLIVAAIVLSLFYTIGCHYDMENNMHKNEYTVFGSFFIVYRAFANQGNEH